MCTGICKTKQLNLNFLFLDVPVLNLLSSKAVFVPCDGQLQGAHYESTVMVFLKPLSPCCVYCSQASGRMALLQDLRKKETRKSLKRVSVPLEPPTKSLPHLPERPSSPRRPPPELRAALTLPTRTGAQSRSPMLQRKKISLPATSLETQAESDRKSQRLSGFELKPPDKPLPPAPKSKSPVAPRRISAPAYLSNARDVSVQLILTRAVKVDSEASAEDLVRAAADTFNMPEGSFALW